MLRESEFILLELDLVSISPMFASHEERQN